ncbi:S-adenosyl-L-homocysteine hydrolase [Sulfitobacter sp. F26169L]|uniref:S-adenosyl-L-homocysteine hydrolase n=1 Tax=Sulfitobacter sp. F26169L TaxID=2996015 RepID=UPI002260E878|nr:S-adenosyl-L-homocysteine hydrolase [Sulfitobacter sp. F26169L]MCX7565864.1 S-adenosyl-L-homocysteine hydrolase [Sulfitobacter sp. F26169L]
MKTAMTAIAALAVMATSAAAQDVCMKASEMQSSLIEWYGERPVAEPTQNDTRLWVSDASGSWTLVRNVSGGKACVVAQGRNWSADMDAQDMVAAIQARTEG